jgi:lipopolysaccharide transport system ATP-binding protein
MCTVIEFNNISKQYHLGVVSTKTLGQDICNWWMVNVLGRQDIYTEDIDVNTHWALRDIYFKVEEGDVVGIVGKNGAGKSTLLKLLSKIVAPTTGFIYTNGRIGSLLEIGTGFHYELTGRENIFMNGAILGMTKNEIKHKLDEIIDFSGCELYIDTPVKRYSQGMMVRLGFAVAAHLNPDILVVDEVLSIGDNEFPRKVVNKLKEINKHGVTILFVSHNMETVSSLCKTGFLLENGKIKSTGDINEIVSQYKQIKY